MINLVVFLEFFKIGLLAIGGGLVTIPFLAELSEKYNWYTAQDLAQMVAISQTSPGAVGINLATYVGYTVNGGWTGVIAVMGLILPSLIIIIAISKCFFCEERRGFLQDFLYGVRPASAALILYGGYVLARISIIDYTSAAFAIISFFLVRWLKWHPIAFISLGAIVGIVFKM